MGDQLARLSKPFASHLIHQNPSGGGRGDYVSHSAVTEKLLAVVGPFAYEVVYPPFYGEVKNKPELGKVVVGCLGRLTVTVDGREVSVTEVGDCEQPGNWPHDGARLKDASSDAIKRCAMRLGVGLHLWSQSEFFLWGHLSKNGGPDVGGQSGTEGEREDAEHGGAIAASPSAASTAPPASHESNQSGPASAPPAPSVAGAGPSPSQPNVKAFLAQVNKFTSPQKIAFKAVLLQNGLPQSSQDMDEDQAHEALKLLLGWNPEAVT